MFPRYLYGNARKSSFRQQQLKSSYASEWPCPLPATDGRLFNGFSYPGHLNIISTDAGVPGGERRTITPPLPHSTPAESGQRFFQESARAEAATAGGEAPLLPVKPRKPIGAFQSARGGAEDCGPFQTPTPFAQPSMWPVVTPPFNSMASLCLRCKINRQIDCSMHLL